MIDKCSITFSDTICDLGGTTELSNYGEYSGAPSEGQTYEYAKTLLSLMTKEIHPEGKGAYTFDVCHEKTDLKVFVVVIPKEGWARMAAPILLLV